MYRSFFFGGSDDIAGAAFSDRGAALSDFGRVGLVRALADAGRRGVVGIGAIVTALSLPRGDLVAYEDFTIRIKVHRVQKQRGNKP